MKSRKHFHFLKEIYSISYDTLGVLVSFFSQHVSLGRKNIDINVQKKIHCLQFDTHIFIIM